MFKLSFSEKATKFEKIFFMILTRCVSHQILNFWAQFWILFSKSTKRLIQCFLSYILSYIFLIWPLFKAIAEKQKYVPWFLVQMKSLEFAFEINWPLGSV